MRLDSSGDDRGGVDEDMDGRRLGLARAGTVIGPEQAGPAARPLSWAAKSLRSRFQTPLAYGLQIGTLRQRAARSLLPFSLTGKQ